MSLNFKNTTLLILTICGFLFFLVNAYELNSNYKDIKIQTTTQSSQNTSNIKNITDKSQIETDKLISSFSKNESKLRNKETIVIVKKGQTFSSLLDNFNFENKKKFEIINAINDIYDLRELKVNQKVIFLINNEEKVENIIIELNYNTNLDS